MPDNDGDVPLEQLNWPPAIEEAARNSFRDEVLWPLFKVALNFAISRAPDAGIPVQEWEWKAVVAIASRYPDHAAVSPDGSGAQLFRLEYRDDRDIDNVRTWKVFYDASDERISYANVVGFLLTPPPPR